VISLQSFHLMKEKWVIAQRHSFLQVPSTSIFCFSHANLHPANPSMFLHSHTPYATGPLNTIAMASRIRPDRQSGSSFFKRLPLEMRDKIYEDVFSSTRFAFGLRTYVVMEEDYDRIKPDMFKST